MARKRCKSEEIVAKLRQVDFLTSQGQNTAAALRRTAPPATLASEPTLN